MTELCHQTRTARTRVKLCGLTREDDVDAAVRVGADALGFVLWPGSKRAVDVDRLTTLSRRVPAFVTRVALLVNPTAAEVERCLPWVDLLQFHGDETAEFCARFAKPWIKALRMRDGLDLHHAAVEFAGASGLLLDAYRPGVPGGTGETFDWSRIPGDLGKPVILAGGLVVDNVVEAVTRVRPFALDVSGGVEAAPGIKDAARMSAFVNAVQVGDRQAD
ncbi:phosphoribosylanthranilate isomerase [Halomonas sp. V046]|uniref:phosphoribosylanthranilate isomerase n=1 Tax=Halomonas sp. V046 TaxID=3459611 RepID=UPI004045063E